MSEDVEVSGAMWYRARFNDIGRNGSSNYFSVNLGLLSQWLTESLEMKVSQGASIRELGRQCVFHYVVSKACE